MTLNQMTQLLSDYAKANDLYFKLENDEDGALISECEFQWADCEIADLKLIQDIYIDKNGNTTCVVMPEIYVPANMLQSIQNLLDQLNDAIDLVDFVLDEEHKIFFTRTRYQYEKEAPEHCDNNILDALFHMSSFYMQKAIAGIHSVMENSCDVASAYQKIMNNL